MRTFVIFPKDKGGKIEASTRASAIRRYAKQEGLNVYELSACLEEQAKGIDDIIEITEIKEQGVVITETPKQAPIACDPEDSKPAARVY